MNWTLIAVAILVSLAVWAAFLLLYAGGWLAFKRQGHDEIIGRLVKIEKDVAEIRKKGDAE